MDELTWVLLDVDGVPEHVWLRAVAHALNPDVHDEMSDALADLVPEPFDETGTPDAGVIDPEQERLRNDERGDVEVTDLNRIDDPHNLSGYGGLNDLDPPDATSTGPVGSPDPDDVTW